MRPTTVQRSGGRPRRLFAALVAAPLLALPLLAAPATSGASAAPLAARWDAAAAPSDPARRDGPADITDVTQWVAADGEADGQVVGQVAPEQDVFEGEPGFAPDGEPEPDGEPGPVQPAGRVSGGAVASCGVNELVSVTSDGTQGDDHAGGHMAVNADGRFVAFQSHAPNLVEGDTNGSADMFVRDRDTGTTERVSVASDGSEARVAPGQSPPHTSSRGISADGRVVAFATGAGNLVEGDTNNATDVFVRDRVAGTTERVSVASDGTESSWHSLGGSVSADGRFVAFAGGEGLAADESGFHVYVRDREAGTTELVSVSSDGTPGTGGRNSFISTGTNWISAGGRFVAFFTDLGGLVPGDEPGTIDAFVHDRQTGETERLSVASDGTPGNSSSGYVRMSDDGRYAAFMSYATNLDPTPASGHQIYLRDREAGTTKRVSVASDGTPANFRVHTPAISGDGRFVSFDTAAWNLVPGAVGGGQQAYLHDRISGVTTRVSVSPDCAAGNGTTGGVSTAGPRISADGSTVVFDSLASDLVPGDTNGSWDAFAYTLPDLHVSLTSLDFGAVLAGQSRTLGVTVTNFSSDPVTVDEVSGPAGPFRAGGSCGGAPFTLAPGASCELEVEFSPTTGGSSSGEVSLAVAGSDRPYSVKLAGVGSDHRVHVGPEPLDFGGVVAGETGDPERVRVTNAADTPVEVQQISAPAAPFTAAEGGSCRQAPFTLEPYASCSLAYTFKPAELGQASAVVEIGSNAGGPRRFGLRGKGLLREVTVSPGAVDFGAVRVGETSGTRTVTLANTGEVEARLREISKPGDGFTLTGSTCQSVLAVGARCTLDYTYSPPRLGQASAAVSVASDGASSPGTIRLGGSGTGSGTGDSGEALVFDPTGLDFGVVEPGATTPPRTATLRNTGAAAVTGLEFAEPGHGFVADTSACGTKLAPGGSCAVRVTFAPGGPGTAAQLLTVTSTQGVTGGLGLTGQRGGGPWPPDAKLTAADGATGDQAGRSVSVDGDTAVVGAPFTNPGSSNMGEAYVFVRGDDGGWEQQATLTRPDSEEGVSLFGYSVAVSGDTALVAAPGTGPDVHAAYVYTRNDGTWSFQAKLTTSDPGMRVFAYGVVALDGDTAMVGDPAALVDHGRRGAVYVFNRSGGTWTEQPRLTASDATTFRSRGFGRSVALDGDTALVGRYAVENLNEAGPGAAYEFTRDQRGGWTERAKLSASDGVSRDGFGHTVALDDGTAVVGARGGTYLYTGGDGDWTEQTKLTVPDGDAPQYGLGLTVALEGDTALVGAPYADGNGANSGAVYAFTHYGGPWTETAKITAADATAGAQLGWAVGISDGAALVGAPNAAAGDAKPGAGYVFDPAALPAAGKITLRATGRVVQGKRSVYVSWQGAESQRMDVYRDGVRVATVKNPGFHVDAVGGQGQARFVYQVCEAGTEMCSNEAAVTFDGATTREER